MAVVTIDPINLRLVEVTTGGDNELDIADIYSDWKRWLVEDAARLAYPQAFRYVGADPISDTRELGSTFFLSGGWRIRPAEHNHKFTIIGNLYTDPAGEDPIIDTLGAFNVRTVLSVSNLIDVVLVGGGVAPTAAENADAVWNRLLDAHVTLGTAGTWLREIAELMGLDPTHPLVVSLAQRHTHNVIQDIHTDPDGTVTLTRE